MHLIVGVDAAVSLSIGNHGFPVIQFCLGFFALEMLRSFEGFFFRYVLALRNSAGRSRTCR